MSDDEDLFDNPFFVSLKKKFSSEYSEIEQGCHVLLVPSASSLGKIDITLQLIYAHVFKLDTQSETKHIGVFDETKIVEIQGGSVTLVSGFGDWPQETSEPAHTSLNGSDPLHIGYLGINPSSKDSTHSSPPLLLRSIPIKFEELFYNKAKQPFRVVCIEHPTTGRSSSSNEYSNLANLRTYDDCHDFLFADPVNKLVLTKLEKSSMEGFISEFAGRPRTEFEVSKRTQELVDFFVQQLLIANSELRELENKPSALKLFEIVVETYVLGRLGPTIMSALMPAFELLDSEIYRVLLVNQGVTLSMLNLRPELICDFSNAIELAIAQFDRIAAPIEKLVLFQDIIQSIQNSIKQSFKVGAKQQDLLLASDDLIPIVVFVLLQAKPSILASQLFYIKNFTRYNLTTSQFGFHLATFTAAVEFIKTDHLPNTGMSISGEHLMHPLDPNHNPRFDPVAAGLQPKFPPSSSMTASNRDINRRSTSYITPPVTTSTQTISTGRTFGTKSSNYHAGPSPHADQDNSAGYTTRHLNRSSSAYGWNDRKPSSIPSSSTSSTQTIQHAPKRQDYGSLHMSAAPVYALTGPAAAKTSSHVKQNSLTSVSSSSNLAAPKVAPAVIEIDSAQFIDLYDSFHVSQTSNSYISANSHSQSQIGNQQTAKK